MAPPPIPAAEAHREGRRGYRPFLDGIRAFAVGGVVVYHLNRTWLPGGYLGVDLFFVLSGYLITSLLLDERARTGRIDLPAFWARRIRRLLPALLVVLVVMAAVIALQGDVLAIGAARGDLLSTLFYVANWHFIASGQSYFSQYLAVSPDRHTWSLAVEEQFYLLWPIVVSLVLVRYRTRGLALVAGVAAIASVALMAILFDPIDPSRAYYGTDTRIFEILVGCLAAMLVAGPFRMSVERWARRLAWPAAAVVAVAFVALADDDPSYYHGAALLVAVAAAAMIVGLEAGSGLRRPLSVRPLVGIGLVSYGVYLWHFPIITFINQAIGPTSIPGLAILALVLLAAAAAISYVFIETPIRRGGAVLGIRLTPRRLAGLVPLSSGVVAAAVLFATTAGVASPEWAGAVASSGGGPATGITIDRPISTTSTTGPTGSPEGTSSPTEITAGGPGLVIGVVGDSVMVSAMPGLRTEAAKRGWTLVEAATAGCPIGLDPLYDAQGQPSPFNARCHDAVPRSHAQLVAAHPDVVVWEDLESVLARRASNGAFLPAGSPAWTADLLRSWTVELDRFLAAGAQVVLVMPPLRSQQRPGCQGVSLQARCLDLQRQDSIIRAATHAFWSTLAARPGVHFATVDPLLCPTAIPCPTTIDGIAVRISGWDQTHFSPDGATWYAPRFMDVVLAALASAAPPPPQ